MSKYERFILYPLVIIALFYGLTGGQPFVVAEGIQERIVAEELIIMNEDGREVIGISSTSGRGEIIFSNKEGAITIMIGEGRKGAGSIMVGDGEIFSVDNTHIGPTGVVLSDFNLSTVITSGGLAVHNEQTDNCILRLVALDCYSGGMLTYNKHGDRSVLIGQTQHGHGGVWVYDKYGDDFRGYGHR